MTFYAFTDMDDESLFRKYSFAFRHVFLATQPPTKCHLQGSPQADANSISKLPSLFMPASTKHLHLLYLILLLDFTPVSSAPSRPWVCPSGNRSSTCVRRA